MIKMVCKKCKQPQNYLWATVRLDNDDWYCLPCINKELIKHKQNLIVDWEEQNVRAID